MQSVSYQSFVKKVGESTLILLSITLFVGYKIIAEEMTYEFLAIGVIALISILSIARLRSIAEVTIRKGHYHISFVESILVGDVVVIGLGFLGLYIFFVKGLYGTYKLLDDFTWHLLLFRILIIVLSYRLVLATSRIQTVYNSMSAQSSHRNADIRKTIVRPAKSGSLRIVKSVVIALTFLVLVAVGGGLGREFGKEVTNKFLRSATDYKRVPTWFTNTYYGFSIETPFKLESVEAKIPEGNKDYISMMQTYFSKEGGTPIMVSYIESSYEAYDVTKGLRGSVSNVVHTMDGTNLVLDFQKPENAQDDVVCSGRFALDQDQWILKGYCYWNEGGKILIITTFGKDNQNSDTVLERVMNSISTNF